MGQVRNTLQQLRDQGQSPWIDYIARDMLQSGRLRELIDLGIVGLTSNPTIFQKAIGGSNLYDDELRQLVRQGKDVDEFFWRGHPLLAQASAVAWSIAGRASGAGSRGHGQAHVVSRQGVHGS